MFVLPFMTRLGVSTSWGGWTIDGESTSNAGFWSYEGVAEHHFFPELWDIRNDF